MVPASSAIHFVFCRSRGVPSGDPLVIKGQIGAYVPACRAKWLIRRFQFRVIDGMRLVSGDRRTTTPEIQPGTNATHDDPCQHGHTRPTVRRVQYCTVSNGDNNSSRIQNYRRPINPIVRLEPASKSKSSEEAGPAHNEIANCLILRCGMSCLWYRWFYVRKYCSWCFGVCLPVT
jgi:hypothetical protein